MRRLALAFLFASVASLTLLWSQNQTVTAQEEAADENWATITGQIVFEGNNIPDRGKIEVTQDKDHCLSKGPLESDTWIVDPETKAIKNVFIWIGPDTVRPGATFDAEQIHPSLAKLTEETVTIDQPCCMFEPHALAARQGQSLVVKNSAPIPHNVNWTSRANGSGNLGTPPGGQVTITAPNEEGLVTDRYPMLIKCNVHPWMSAYVRVYDHPYYAVTDEEGNFEIKLAPVGPVRLFVWHEDVGYKGGSAGARGEEITLKPGVNDLGKISLSKE